MFPYLKYDLISEQDNSLILDTPYFQKGYKLTFLLSQISEREQDYICLASKLTSKTIYPLFCEVAPLLSGYIHPLSSAWQNVNDD